MRASRYPYPGPGKSPRGRGRRGKLLYRAVLAVAVLVLVLAAVSRAFSTTGTNGCPTRTTYDTSVMSDYCVAPSGRVVCVVDSFGFVATPGGDPQGDQFVRRPPLGPWCRQAHALTFGPQVRPVPFSTK